MSSAPQHLIATLGLYVNQRNKSTEYSASHSPQIDHFGFLEDGTFKQRYLVSDKHWQQPGGPILFYTGNEGDITWFCNNTVNIPSLPRTSTCV